MRNEESSVDLCSVPQPKRKRGGDFEVGLPHQSEDEGTDEDSTSVYYRHLYYEVLDSVMMQMNTRFADIERIKFFSLLDQGQFL